MTEARLDEGPGRNLSFRGHPRLGLRSHEETKAGSDEASAPARLGYMQALRAGFIAVVAWSNLFTGLTLESHSRQLFIALSAYGGLIALTEIVRRRSRRMNSGLTAFMLLADAIFLAWTLSASGGTLSPIRFLIYIHLIAATLIYSYRAGLIVALVHSLLLYGVYKAQVAGFLGFELTDSVIVGEAEMTAYQTWIFNTLVYWLIALATAPFSSINERELRRRKADLGVLAEMVNELENLQDPVAIASAVLDRICDTFEFGRGVVLAVHDDELVLMAQRGAGERTKASNRIDSLIDKAWDKREAVLVARLHEESDPMLSELMPFGQNLLVAPMFADGQPFGVLVLERQSKEEPVIQRRVISMVLQFASHGALAMRKAWLLYEVQRLAETDALTGIANRRSFEEALDHDISRSIRSHEELTLVLVDLDHFKVLNDRYGHQAGDEVLRKVGAVLRAACRESDTPARYGGEEFAVLLPSCGTAQALDAAERIRDLIAGIDSPMPVTASAGVATYPAHARNATEMVEAADEALYESKDSGRNRSTLSSRKLLRVVGDSEASS
jgi:two-component system, cell cycle response regulator